MSEACEDVRRPHALGAARLYPCGWRCASHTPAALMGRPESPPGPGWPSGAYRTEPDPEPPAEQEQST